MDVQSNIPKRVNICKKCYKSKRNTYPYTFDINQKSIKNDHIKAINHYSYTSPVKTKVLNLYNNKNLSVNRNNKVSIETSKEEKALLNKENTQFKIHQLIPNTGPAHGGIQVTIRGQGFYDGLYVVYGNCIIETEFIDSNNLTFYLPPNPKCFHYNGRKTVKEDLFVIDLYKSLISHAEFNTNISDSFNIMLEIIIKIIISRVGINLNDLSFKKLGNTNNSQSLNKNNGDMKQQKLFGNTNSNLFSMENNYILNSLKSIQNSISFSFTQQEKAFSSLINKTKEFIPSFPSFPSFPTFYIPNSRNSINSRPNTTTIMDNHVNSPQSSSSTITPVIKINLSPSLSLYQPYNNLFSPLSHAQAISFTNSNINLNLNKNIITTSTTTSPLSSNLSSSLPVISNQNNTQFIHHLYTNTNVNTNINTPMNTNMNTNANTNQNNTIINLNQNSLMTSRHERLTPSINESLSSSISNSVFSTKLLSNSNTINTTTTTTTITTTTTNLSQDVDDMAIEGDDEMEENEREWKCSCHIDKRIILPKSSSISSTSSSSSFFHPYKKSFRERHHQENQSQEEVKKREHQKNYLEGKKIEKLLEDCVKKSNEAKSIEPDELLYYSSTTTTTTTARKTKAAATTAMTSSLYSSSTQENSFYSEDHDHHFTPSKRSITIKITLIHLGIILCMTRLIYYILKYCKLCSRVQNHASEVSTKIHDMRNNVKKDGIYSIFSTEKHSSTTTTTTTVDNSYHYGNNSYEYLNSYNNHDNSNNNINNNNNNIIIIKYNRNNNHNHNNIKNQFKLNSLDSIDYDHDYENVDNRDENQIISNNHNNGNNNDVNNDDNNDKDNVKKQMNLLEFNSSNSSSSSPSSSPTLSPSNILTPSSSSNDYLLTNVHPNDTQYPVRTVKTKKRSTYLKIIDQGDTIGNTPLHYATIAHSPSLFNMLIEAGANINKENIYGQTVLDLAYSIGDETMVNLIENLMNEKEGGRGGGEGWEDESFEEDERMDFF
ncbi:hypothetical protein LY90DRAFT_671301 [Neocallimastix californiae]|uniref:Uncharacterized protein n=1 Tax=Neocallimastix californiae TaxID=1754190 RepID=A0A1Y2CIL2_9FUNG|nr:hypothetical protein LY90DRAFT_671301 [Neocallimastix californiae]|eukprot:ORY46664.1 hypothetical protein LY90DRAFT_671301 [Neocallimastix californiae]